MQNSIVVTPMTRQEALTGVPKVARTAFRLAEQIQRGTLEATLPDGRTLIFKGPVEGPTAQFRINDYRFAWRLMRSGDIGIAEAYLRGEWETPDLTRFLYLFCVNQAMLQSVLAHPLVRWVQAFRHWLNRNTKRQARKNIHAHYDLGNTFYKAWLDPSMTYSSALFDKGSQDLSAAQMRKYESLAHQIDLKTGHTVLEIGCGWGGFAEYAAKTVGANVVGLTISREQFDYASRRMFEAGLSEKVDIRLQD
jgi:cyclopropane-fatty-acyl-phospholipid synthase